MIAEPVIEAIDILAAEISIASALRDSLELRFRGVRDDEATPLAVDAIQAADLLDQAMPELTRTERGLDALAELVGTPRFEVIFTWCASAVSRSDARLAPLLACAKDDPTCAPRVAEVARDRVVEGPLLDALGCAPLLGPGTWMREPANAAARSRMEILFWEAGASAREVPELGAWVWSGRETFDAVVATPARGSLRGRVVAARCLEICVRGLPPDADPELVHRTLRVLQPLLLHPEPVVWTHAARALGRLTFAVEHLEGMLLDWLRGESPILRQRAMTAFASMPAERLTLLGHELQALIESEEEDYWALAAAAVGTPYLFHERRDIWDKLAARILGGAGGAMAARALTRGLATLYRRGHDLASIEPTLRTLRDRARRIRTDYIDVWRAWLDVLAVTDAIDGAERDPLDLELGLENLMRLAAQYDDEEADARAARFAEAIAPTFVEARRIVLGDGSIRHRAAAMNAFEGCARSLALRLWGPQLATRPTGDDIHEPNLESTWSLVAHAPAELLDLVTQVRKHEEHDPELCGAIEVLAVRLGCYALDACGEDSDLGPGAGPTAHTTILWLRKLDGLADGSRELPLQLRSALSALFWRLVDTTRGTALGEVDDATWIGPFAAWWAVVIDRPAMLRQLASAMPMIDPKVLEDASRYAAELRDLLDRRLPDGQWGEGARQILESLSAHDTELAEAVTGFAKAIEGFATAAGNAPDLDASCLELVLAAERLQAALADPVKGLHPPGAATDDTLTRTATENAPRLASLLGRAIRARDLTMLDVWFSSLGPVTSALVETAVTGAVSRTPPAPPAPKKVEPKVIEGYELVKPIGEGGIGSVWLVRKPGADRLFVLKIPKADALADASESEREGILASFVEEAKALAGLYHPNVANIIDRGVSHGAPFLVLEYLIGADLKQYSQARLMTFFELRSVVSESCAGLAALHGAGLVHRDIKPANLWLRLPLAGGERFDPEKHREPARAQPLSTVVIDFGMVRAMRVPAEAGGRFVAGTPGYIAPEQVLDPVELDGRADVYALAGTVYNCTTGRTFFDDIENPRSRIIAHMRQDPFEDAERLASFPAGIARLMRAATARDYRDRPMPLEFGREFAAQL